MKTKTASVLLALFTSLFFLISCQQKNENKTQVSQNNFSSQNTKIHEPYDYELDQVFIAPEESDEPVQMSGEGEQMYFTSENQEKELFQVTEVDSSVETMEEELSPAQIAIRKLEKALDEQNLEKVTAAWDELQELGTSALTQKDRDVIHDLQDKMDRLMGY